MANHTCSIEGCDKPARSMSAEWCPMHYHRWYRHGHPLTKAKRVPRQDLAGKRFGLLIVLEYVGVSRWRCLCDCGAETRVTAFNLTGGHTTTCGDKSKHWRSEDAGYTAAHDRVRRDRGSARTHSCAVCGEPAKHWAYDHNDPNGLESEGLAYSLDPSHYDPLCVSCHKKHDLERLGRR